MARRARMRIIGAFVRSHVDEDHGIKVAFLRLRADVLERNKPRRRAFFIGTRKFSVMVSPADGQVAISVSQENIHFGTLTHDYKLDVFGFIGAFGEKPTCEDCEACIGAIKSLQVLLGRPAREEARMLAEI